jgi:DNA segregation ATPase FtsK/SpoIIIE, S-DNA-T family
VRLRLTVSRADHRQDLEVVADPGDTVGDLLRALGIGEVEPLELDGGPVDQGLLLSQVRPGSSLAMGSVPRRDPPPAVAQVHVVAGLDAARAFALQPGRHTLAETADGRITLGAGFARARLDVGADGSVRMWDVESPHPGAPTQARAWKPVRIGRLLLRVSSPSTGRPEHGPHSRPPRASPPGSPQKIPLPVVPPPGDPRPRIGWAALLAPMAMGAAMAALFNPMMAVFALIGPLMLLAQWAEDRTGRSRRQAAAAAVLQADLDLLRGRLLLAASTEADRIRAVHPDLPEIVDRALTGKPSLWERRRNHDDFLLLAAGPGSRPWAPPVEGSSPPEVSALIEQCSRLALVPCAIGLQPGSGVGIVGTTGAALAVARGLLIQAVVLHGPADLRVALLTSTDRTDRWEWLKWLPQCRLGSHVVIGERLLPDIAARPAKPQSTGPVGSLAPKPPVTLLVVDLAGPMPDEARRFLTTDVALLALTGERRNLPALCSTVIEVDGVKARCERLGNGAHDVVLATGVSADTAEAVARALAGLSDPEAEDETARLPERVRLFDLVGVEEPTPEVIAARWSEAPKIAATIGVSDTGPLIVDLVADGPHGLVGGTTGSGKSELLRTFVASLALSVDPDHLVFVLVDYKGGSAFDVCAQLPHTVGLVTDLDERLAGRALACLEAELRYREERLRLVGASDLGDYWAAGPTEPLPRLLVVIDEFAALSAELPEFMAALLDIAQRGRSLGVHLLLATQRPAGVVSEGIKANTNIRIALRMHDQSDSTDVLGAPDAASLGRHTPGRAFLRLGPAERVGFQTAMVTGQSTATDGQGPRLGPFSLTETPPTPERTNHDGCSDLVRLVSAITAAAAGFESPRRPWPPPLADRITRRQLDPGCFALADEPRRQRTVPVGPPFPSPMLLYGARGSGTTTALAAVGLALAAVNEPDDLHIYVLDFDSQGLGPLADLPHTGAAIGAAERERQIRLLRFLRAEVERRRVAAGGPTTDRCQRLSRIVVLLDGLQGFNSAFDAPADLVWKESLPRLMANGPGFGISVIATADRPGAVPGPIAGLVADRLVFRLADPYDYASFGLRPPSGRVPPGRAIDARTGRELQVACFESTLEEEVAAIAAAAAPPMRPPQPIGVLPSRISITDLIGGQGLEDPDWQVPVGIGDDALEPVALRLAPSEPVLIAGGPRSGRSAMLLTIARVVGRCRRDLTMGAIALAGSPLRGLPEFEHLVTDSADIEPLCDLMRSHGSALLLIDDADRVEDPSGALAGLLAEHLGHLRVVIAGRTDSLRAAYGHWTQRARRSAAGVLLQPMATTDGDLWQRQLPPLPPDPPPGRGFIIDGGGCQLFQAALP